MICQKCGSAIEDNTHFCPYCGAPPLNLDDLPTGKASDTPEMYAQTGQAAQDYTPEQPAQAYTPGQTAETYTSGQSEQAYLPAQPEQSYSSGYQMQQYPPEQQYAPDMQVSPFPAEQQFPQQYGTPQQGQYIQPYAAPQQMQQPYPPQPQYIQPPAPQMYYEQGSQMPYAQPDAGYQAPQTRYSGMNGTSLPTVNIPAAIIVLVMDIAFAVSFFLNMFFAVGAFGGKGEFSLFKTYEYFSKAFEAIGKFFELLGKTGIDAKDLDLAKYLPGELWVTLGIVLLIFILFLISMISTIAAITRAFTCRGPRVTYFWSSAGSAAGTAFSAFLIAWGATFLYNAKMSGLLDSVSGAKYYELMGVNALFYVMFGLSLAAVILSGVMKSIAKKQYITGGTYISR